MSGNNNRPFEQDQTKEKLLQAQQKVDTLKYQMHDNIVLAMERGEKLDVLSSKAEELNTDSKLFQGGAGRLRNKMWWESVKAYLMIGGVILIVVGILITIIVVMTKGNDSSNRRLLNDVTNGLVASVTNSVRSGLTNFKTGLKINIEYPFTNKYLQIN